MYKVTTRTPTKITAEEYWAEEWKAQIRRDLINRQCDEFTGAILENVIVSDLDLIKTKETDIEICWPDPRSLADITISLQLSNDNHLFANLEVECNISGDLEVSFSCDLSDFIHSDEEGKEIPFEPARDAVQAINKIVQSYTEDERYFDAYENEEVDEANRLSFDDSHPEPNTL